MSSFIKCPICGRDLELRVDERISISKKIKKDGGLYKVTNRSEKGEVISEPYLKCASLNCTFIYDVENGYHEKHIEALDNWIQKHLEEIYELE